MPCTSAIGGPPVAGSGCGSTSMTPVRPLTSRPGAELAVRARNRLVVCFASRTGSPGGMAAYDVPSRSTARTCSSQARSATRRNYRRAGDNTPPVNGIFVATGCRRIRDQRSESKIPGFRCHGARTVPISVAERPPPGAPQASRSCSLMPARSGPAALRGGPHYGPSRQTSSRIAPRGSPTWTRTPSAPAKSPSDGLVGVVERARLPQHDDRVDPGRAGGDRHRDAGLDRAQLERRQATVAAA